MWATHEGRGKESSGKISVATRPLGIESSEAVEGEVNKESCHPPSWHLNEGDPIVSVLFLTWMKQSHAELDLKWMLWPPQTNWARG